MTYDLSLLHVSMLMLAGLASGFINTLAGGGSLLTVPALMLMGLPAHIANGSNRVAVFAQSITAVSGFHRERVLDNAAIIPMLIPSSAGSIAGALVAASLPIGIFKPVLLGTMMLMTLFILLWPGAGIPPLGTQALRVQDKPSSRLWLFLTGFYGGFAQAGVGFLLLAVLCSSLRYDLLRANALKMVCSTVFGGVAAIIFALHGQVLWIPALILSGGCIIGAHLSVKFAINAQQKTLKRIVLLMALIMCIAAMFNS
jgi:uncharacterized protein